MARDLAITNKVEQLRRAGLRPQPRLAETILRAGESAVPPLLALALQIELLHEAEPQCFAPLHALRLLGELGSLAMINPLLDSLPIELEYEGEELPLSWANEMPQIIARIGPPAIEPLWAIVDNTSRPEAARHTAIDALTYISAIDPQSREAIIVGLRERTQQTDDEIYRSFLVIALCELGVASLYGEIMALYHANRINQDILAPAQARQLLLGGGKPQLECAKHALWERYDLHGPKSEAQENET